MKYGSKANLSTKIGRKLEIAQNAKSCSKRKKLLEIREVAKKLPSNLWKALVVVHCYIVKFTSSQRDGRRCYEYLFACVKRNKMDSKLLQELAFIKIY